MYKRQLYTANPPTPLSEENLEKTVQLIQVSMNALYLSMVSLNAPLIARNEMLNSISNRMIHSSLLSEIDSSSCVDPGQQEKTDLSSVKTGADAVLITLQVSKRGEANNFFEVIGVPYLVNNQSYAIDVAADLLFEIISGRVLDRQNCELEGAHILVCSSVTTRTHNCVTDAWGDNTVIPAKCHFKNVPFQNEPYYKVLAFGTLISQLSADPLVIAYNGLVIAKKPVLIRHSLDITMTLKGQSYTVEGVPSTGYNVASSPLSKEQLFKHIHPKQYLLQKFIPDSYSDYAYIGIASIVFLLCLPYLFKALKWILVCFGCLEKKKGKKRWYAPRNYAYVRPRRRHTPPCHIEDNYNDSCSEDNPAEEMLQLRSALGPNTDIALLRNLLEDVGRLTLPQFLLRYREPRQELIDVYTLVRGHPRRHTPQRRYLH